MAKHRVKRVIPDDGSGVRKIGLTRGLVAIVDAEDYERVAEFNWYAVPSDPPGGFYAVRGTRIGGKYRNVFMHNELLGIQSGGSLEVDHKDHDGLNNRRDNIRLVERFQNMRNRRKLTAKTSAFKGVYWKKANLIWEARIAAGVMLPSGKRKQLILGQFRSETDAARAYNDAAVEHFGEFAVLNII